MDSISLKANAKINLFLQVLGRLPSGYHGLRSLIVPISLGDELIIERRSSVGVELECSFSEDLDRHISALCRRQPDFSEKVAALSGADNLAFRAAELILSRCAPRSCGLRLRILKRLPLMAGLGGGSADAAAVLKGVNSLLKLGLAREELADLASDLGSDVSALLFEGPVLVYGSGDDVLELETCTDAPAALKKRQHLVLLKSQENSSTAAAYRELQITAECDRELRCSLERDRALCARLASFGLTFKGGESTSKTGEKLNIAPTEMVNAPSWLTEIGWTTCPMISKGSLGLQVWIFA